MQEEIGLIVDKILKESLLFSFIQSKKAQITYDTPHKAHFMTIKLIMIQLNDSNEKQLQSKLRVYTCKVL